MKATFTLMSVLILFVLCAAGTAETDAPSARTNLFPNPELQGKGSAAASWRNLVRQGQYEFRHLPKGGPDDLNAMVIEGSGGHATCYVDFFVVKGASYELTLQMKIEGACAGQVLLGPNKWSSGAADWKQARLGFTAAQTGTTRVHVFLIGDGRVSFARPALYTIEGSPLLSMAGEPVPARGGALERIVVGPDPGPVEMASALDLRRIFQAVTGVTVAIRSTASRGRCLYIGCGPADEDLQQKLEPLGEEGAYLRIGPDAVVCAGGGPRGTYYAVQELLYRMGCQWIWPGKYGECLPAAGPLPLPEELTVRHEPAFELRGETVVQVAWRPGKPLGAIHIEEWMDWSARNRINRLAPGYPGATYDTGPGRGHSWDDAPGHTTSFLLPPTLFTRHPEWFALVNGKRVVKCPKTSLPAQPCVSNPEFIEHVTQRVREHFTAHPRGKRFVIGHNDSACWCECARCKALDPKPVDWSKNGQVWANSWKFHMTDRWLYMVNEVAERIEKEFPGRRIGMFAYVNTWEPPVKIKPRTNVMIEWCASHTDCRKHPFLKPGCPVNDNGRKASDEYGGGRDQLKRWLAMGAVSIYGYLDHHFPQIPSPFLSGEQDWYPSLHRLGVRHISDEVNTTPHASPVLLGFRARMQWDLNTKVRPFVARFCRIAYGPAAKEMAAFWWLQDKAVMTSPTPHSHENDFARYTPQIIRRSHEILDRALKRPLSDAERARVERAQMAMWCVDYYAAKKIEAAGIKPGSTANGDKAPDAFQQAEHAKGEILKIMQRHGFAVPIGAYNKLGLAYQTPVVAMQGRTLLSLPQQWLFRTDPQDVGEKERWFDASADPGNFKPISTHTNWEAQWVGEYDGAGWYATDVTIPQAEGKRVWLLFGAVDETWKVWLDGKSIGASHGDPGVIWDKPAALQITGKYPPGKKVRLVVRVHDTRGAGGIWKPVRVTASY